MSDYIWYLEREPFHRHSHWEYGPYVTTVTLVVISVLAVPIVCFLMPLSLWLGLLLVLAAVFVPWRYAFKKWRTAQPELLSMTASRDLWVRESVTKFVNQWSRLDASMQHELADMYRGVVRLAEAALPLPSCSLQRPLIHKIDDRTTVVRDIADELDQLKADTVHEALADIDAHALEAARLYVKAFQDLRKKELNP